tara:strand:- start:994 stop:1155 length:162 start_codon:yes stop_codon:yes gene_type:complete
MDNFYSFIIEYIKRQDKESKRLPIQVPVEEVLDEREEVEKKKEPQRGVVVIEM